MPTPDDVVVKSQRDWARRPLDTFLWWVLPIAIGMSAGLLRLPVRSAAIVWAVSFAWMATGCILNAIRCHRLHCYISGPIFLLATVVAGLLAAGVNFGLHALNNTVSIAFVLALLSFVPELIWKRYT
jgi:hypothetical protein